MKPTFPVFTHIYVLIAKVKNLLGSVYIAPLTTANRARAYPVGLIGVLFFFQVTAGQSSHGTAEFIIRTPNEVVAAADSRVTYGNGSIDANGTCKIRRFGSVFVAVAGAIRNDPTGFNIFSILTTAGLEKLPLEDQIGSFEARFKGRFERTLAALKLDILRPGGAIEYKKVLSHPPEATFFGLAHGKPFLHRSALTVNTNPANVINVGLERVHCPSADCPEGIGTVSVEPGATGRYQHRLEREIPHYWKANLVNIAKRFVQMQIDDGLAEVGPPIDVLRVTKDGAKWITPEPTCDKDDKRVDPSGPSRLLKK